MLDRRGFLLMSVVAATACRRRRASPEQQVRDAISALEAAVEKKDLPAARELISETFTGDEAQDRGAAMGLLSAVTIRFPHVHLLTRVVSVDIPAAATAQARVAVAAAGHPLNAFDDLNRLSADILIFDVSLAEEATGTWRITRAAWRGGEPHDFLGTGSEPGR